MNKTELVAAMAESADLSKKDAEKALKAFIEVVTDELKKDEFLYVVPDFRLNKVQQLENLLQKDMDKVEFLKIRRLHAARAGMNDQKQPQCI